MKKVDRYELKPCPFCGREAGGFAQVYMRGADWYYVDCQNVDCYATGPVDLGKSGAAEKWNDRQEK